MSQQVNMLFEVVLLVVLQIFSNLVFVTVEMKKMHINAKLYE